MENLWHLRRVADNAAKACWICYKPSTSVLITPSNKDFFYICPGHLSDKGFCQPEADEAKRIADQKKQDELDREIEAVKKEYEEKQKLKREKRKGKDKDKDKEKEKETKGKEEEEDKQDEKAKDDKACSIWNFYQMRLDKLRNAEIAKRNRERLNNPANFPSVPSGNP
ncbi:unnamed protein product [Alternaria alternata]|uniref:DUF1742-domain-containing protein n=1 Tax=Alternaria tenuissima TaxID=119927 RepID=A0AB37WLP1_9PLEO|nr:hypothetical protein AA0111_g4395 [Alternaria arborescens]KAH6858368.1 AAA-ATPase Vps4-associated protein 1-domain-containing protein [Alternaria alternata]OWY48870.1 DUF1742-like protein [Alternaria alternata]RYN29493.1 hypothetical protein AA0115_g5404 [Alternaria tenuissima]RYO32651.1 hypothetical protein AA0111_g4395 [Alternaria arborescens]